MELDPVKNTAWVKLPFIAHLKPNRFVSLEKLAAHHRNHGNYVEGATLLENGT